VAGGGGADLMIRFRLKRGGDGTKHCRKKKRRHSELILAPQEGSVIRCSVVVTSAEGVTSLSRGKVGDDVSWVGVNLTK
jgi:hypothetical protein